MPAIQGQSGNIRSGQQCKAGCIRRYQTLQCLIKAALQWSEQDRGKEYQTCVPEQRSGACFKGN